MDWVLLYLSNHLVLINNMYCMFLTIILYNIHNCYANTSGCIDVFTIALCMSLLTQLYIECAKGGNKNKTNAFGLG